MLAFLREPVLCRAIPLIVAYVFALQGLIAPAAAVVAHASDAHVLCSGLSASGNDPTSPAPAKADDCCQICLLGGAATLPPLTAPVLLVREVVAAPPFAVASLRGVASRDPGVGLARAPPQNLS